MIHKAIKEELLDTADIENMTAARLEGRDWPEDAFTMIGLKRLNNIEKCIAEIVRKGIPGHFIETGVWRGGACIFMKHLLNEYGLDRLVYVADSFCGLPEPEEKYPADNGDLHHTYTPLSVSMREVAENFQYFGLLDNKIIFVPGWFKDTLHAVEGSLALLRLDGDMYGSTMEALTALYDKVNTGGYIIVDDYALEGCRKAVDDFRKEKGITTAMVQIDWTGWYWIKE